jgi:endogenous inhibitor of DNA gyrase (YacG/DUF329 family)
MPACPICKRTAAPRSTNVAFPFCSTRCKQVDLGQWLDEAYRLPADDAALDGDLEGGAEKPKLEDA